MFTTSTEPRIKHFFSRNTISMRKNFLICGLIGWSLEIIFTAFDALRHREMKLKGHTSLWMFPIYGMAFLILPVYSVIKKIPLFFRGIIYGVCFFAVEFFSGSFLKKLGICPWDYSKAKTNINGVIRLDYFPFWIGAGLLYERILTKFSP